VVAVAEAENTLLGPALLLIAPRAPERRVEAVRVQRLLQPFRLPHVGVQRSVVERVDSFVERFGVPVDYELVPGGGLIPRRIHVPELPGRVDVEQREGQRTREEGFLRQVQHHRRILAHRKEHYRLCRLRDCLPEDEDALGLEPVEVGEVAGHSTRGLPVLQRLVTCGARHAV